MAGRREIEDERAAAYRPAAETDQARPVARADEEQREPEAADRAADVGEPAHPTTTNAFAEWLPTVT